VTLLAKTVPITTDAEGNRTITVRAGGCRLHAVDIGDLGDLEAFDLTITEQPQDISLLALTGINATARHHIGVPMSATDGTSLVVEGVGSYAPPVVLSRIQIVVANGGDSKSGEITLLLER